THTYHISGITCSGCINTIKNALYRIPGINQVDIEQASGNTSIVMEKLVATNELQQALKNTKYQLSEQAVQSTGANDSASMWVTYKPVLILLGMITLVSLAVQLNQDQFNHRHWMMHFMAGFFISFSFFKLLDVPAFANSYSNYDIVAKNVKAWGYIYPFVELALGIIMLIPAIWFEANVAALVIMSISSIGVIQNQFNKSPFQCACLGTVFNLPLGKISLIEDLLMVGMSAWLLFA
ncbi:MAG: MauE/DoxX family redox-associated membrane protein, partial [Bacteroidota bacterium]